MKHRSWLGFVVAASLACGSVPSLPDIPELPEVPEAADPIAAEIDTAADLPAIAEAPPAPAPEEIPVVDADAEADADAEPGPELPVAAPVEPVPAPPAGDDDDEKTKRPPAPAPSGITRVSDRSWRVTPTLVDRWKEDPYKLSNVREQGDGWELLGVRQRNAYHLGMRNRDVLLEVNGHKLNTRAQLLLAYLALKNDRAFDLVFQRQGQRLVHHYEIER